MPVNGGAVRPLTAEFDRSIEHVEWSADSKHLFFSAGDRGDTGIYRVSAGAGRVERIVGGERMVLGFSTSKAGDVAFVACTPERPVDLYVAKPGGRPEKQITDFNAKVLAGLQIAKTEAVRFKAPDDRAIDGWLLKPIGFKKGKKYPLAVNMHGGPHVMWGPSMPGMFFEWQFHAARGYAVFYCNPRGSDGYGTEFATLIQGNWGEDVMDDVLTGVDTVAAMGFVDTRRMALTGGSYAGYMTAWIAGHDPRFACAWSQRGLYSLVSFYGVTDIPQLLEREFDLAFPGDDLEKSWRQSPLAYARNIKTPLAIEHQENDYRCPISEGEQLFAALKRLKREVMFVRYPREGHEMSRSGEPQHRVDRLNRMVAWFDKWCRR
jgi:dipeptidyl aminopeptidase/acylaminoacyl peptidase